jgi:hypothetical protein
MPGWAPRGMKMPASGPLFCEELICGMLVVDGWSEGDILLVPRA